MRRLLSQVPAYALTAFSGMGLLLFADLLYLLIRDSNFKALMLGIALILGVVLVLALIHFKYPLHRVAFIRKYSSSVHFLRAARLLAVAVGAFLPALLIRIYTGHDPASTGAFTGTGAFVTKQGEYRCEHFPDGSDVCLNTSSVVRYAFDRNARNIELVSGEAFFEVRHERRPFNVLSGSLLIHDLSTSFDVYRKPNSTLVTVIDGRVRIIAPLNQELRRKFEKAQANNAWDTAPEFHQLQQVEFHEDTGTLQVRPDLSEQRLARILAWREGQIDLDGLTLGEALDELLRYQPATTFRFSDRSLLGTRVSGSVNSTDLDSFLAALEQELHIHYSITRSGDGTLITLSRQR